MSEISGLPQRVPHNQSMATTLPLWNTRNRSLLNRVVAGLRALDCPSVCACAEPIRGYAHAHQVMDAHRGHRCSRYDFAAEYAVRART